MDEVARLTAIVRWYSQQLTNRDLQLAQATVENEALKSQLDASIDEKRNNAE